jgi:phosphatidylglycerophosphate synthase
MTSYSFQDIIKSYSQKSDWERQFPINYYIIRPISFVMTYFIIRWTTSPTRIAWIGFIVGLAGCFCFLLMSWISPWPAIILLFTFSLLDGVDGNIARTTGNVTFFGKFLDSVMGEIIEAGYCFCIGFGLSAQGFTFLHSGANDFVANSFSSLPLLCGAIIMGGRLLSSFIDVKHDYHVFEKQASSEQSIINIDDPIQTSIFSNKWYYFIFINLNLLNNQIVFLIICTYFGKVNLFLYLLAPYYLIRAITYCVFFFSRAKEKLV